MPLGEKIYFIIRHGVLFYGAVCFPCKQKRGGSIMNPTNKAKVKLTLAGIFYVISAAVTIGLAIGIQRVVDAAYDGDTRALVTTLIIVLAVVIPVYFLVGMVAARFRAGYVQDKLLEVKQNRMGYVFNRTRRKIDDDTAKEASFFTADVDILDKSYYSNRARLPLYIAQFVFALGMMLWINWVVTLVAIVVSLLPMMVSNIFGAGLMKRKKAYSDEAADYIYAVNEYIQGRRDIVAYDKQPVFLQKHDEKNRRVEKTRRVSNIFEVLAGLSSVSLGLAAQVAVIGVSAYFVIQGSMTLGFLVAVIQLVNQLLQPVFQAVEGLNGMRSAKAIVEKANQTAPTEVSGTTAIGAFNNTLQIKNLGISYEAAPPVVNNLNLTFHKGGKYAISAPSGFGKSSIARAMALEFADFEGSITLDGQDIRTLNTSGFHRIQRYVRQTPHLFTDTALNNLLFFEAMPDKAELDSIMSITRLKEFMPNEDALQRTISNTSGLSGGQKQRIILARALLHKPQILILDEITAGIDLETSYRILSDLFADKELTCIVITHETDEGFLSLFDEVITLENV
jgi:ATP-binding cassette subfamily C protein